MGLTFFFLKKKHYWSNELKDLKCTVAISLASAVHIPGVEFAKLRFLRPVLTDAFLASFSPSSLMKIEKICLMGEILQWDRIQRWEIKKGASLQSLRIIRHDYYHVRAKSWLRHFKFGMLFLSVLKAFIFSKLSFFFFILVFSQPMIQLKVNSKFFFGWNLALSCNVLLP